MASFIFCSFKYIDIKEVIHLKNVDICDKTYYDLLNEVFLNIKDLINWDIVASTMHKKLNLYSDKKKCQSLLALVDSTCAYGLKFNATAPSRTDILTTYFNNFGLLYPLNYFKAYRQHYLIDIFGLFVDRYTELLRKANYSMVATSEMVKAYESQMLVELVSDISEESKIVLDNVNSEDEYNEVAEKIIEACDDVTLISTVYSCNCKRTASNLLQLLFDIQELEFIAFNDRYQYFRHIVKDEFKLIHKKKQFSNLISTLLSKLTDKLNIKYDSSTIYDKYDKRTVKIHNVYVADPINTNEVYQFVLKHDDPIIIREIEK